MARASEARQRDTRGYQTFYDQHGRRWGSVMDLSCKGGPSPVGTIEYVEHAQGDSEYRYEPPWLPEQAYLTVGSGNRYNQIDIDYERMVKDARRAHRNYRAACIAAAQELNEDYEPGEVPSAKVKRVVGPPPKPLEPIAAAMQGNAWILGKSNVAHPKLADLLRPAVVEEDEDWLAEMDFTDEEESEFPKHLGGPNWELSDGSRVQGKRVDAEKAQRGLSVGAVA